MGIVIPFQRFLEKRLLGPKPPDVVSCHVCGDPIPEPESFVVVIPDGDPFRYCEHCAYYSDLDEDIA